MGKASRNKRLRNSQPRQPARLFHGGAPGLRPGDVVTPSTVRGDNFQYLALKPTYDPSQVYLTTDVGVATAYAARYLGGDGLRIPGDVYRVAPRGRLAPDPDYARLFPAEFLMTSRAEVVEVVEHGVELTVAEQCELERRYLVWGSRDSPVYDAEGFMLPSDQMMSHGITPEYLRLFGPWVLTHDISGEGRVVLHGSHKPFRQVLDRVPSLDRDHIITAVPPASSGTGAGLWACPCGARYEDPSAAVIHQLGERELELLGPAHGWWTPGAPPAQWREMALHMALTAQTRNPHRWLWTEPWL